MLPWMLRSRRPHCVSSTARARLFLKPMWQAIPMRLRIVLHLITASCDDTNVDHDRSMHLHELSKKPLTSTPNERRPAWSCMEDSHVRNAEKASCSVPYTFIKLLKPEVTRTS